MTTKVKIDLEKIINNQFYGDEIVDLVLNLDLNTHFMVQLVNNLMRRINTYTCKELTLKILNDIRREIEEEDG